MLKISAPYTIDTNARLVMSALRWPDRCACCGCPRPSASVTLFHTVRATSSTTVTPLYRTTTRSGYPLSWQVPYCEACRAHQKKARNLVSPGLLLVVGFLIALGVGYALYDAGYSDNYLAVGGYVVLLGLMALAGWQLYRVVGAARLRLAAQAMTHDCTNPAPAVTVFSDMACILFTFSSDTYARDFVSTNNL